MFKRIFSRSAEKKPAVSHFAADESNSPLSRIRLNISRETFNYSKFSKAYSNDAFVGISLLMLIKAYFVKNLQPNKHCVKNAIYSRVPALKWLQTYNLKEYLIADILSGIAVAIVHIPQSMGYAVLATLAPVYGLYTSFFPVLFYWIFGTSRQISMGTFSVVALMVGNNLADMEPKYVPPVGFNYTAYHLNQIANVTNKVDASNFVSLNRDQARVLIVMAHAFWVGAIQMGMFLFQLGFLTNYLSESLLNGFVNGCAVHVFTSQIKLLFGVSFTSYVGAFKIPKVSAFSNLIFV